MLVIHNLSIMLVRKNQVFTLMDYQVLSSLGTTTCCVFGLQYVLFDFAHKLLTWAMLTGSIPSFPQG
jgi:hypothetical protein